MKFAFAALLTLTAPAALAQGNVDDFSRKTGLRSGGEYTSDQSNCPEGEFTIEPDEPGGILLRLGPDILAENIGETALAPQTEGRCTTSFKTIAIENGRVETLKEKHCTVKGLENVSWHSVITVTPRGFDQVVTYATGKSRKCQFIRK